MPRLTLSDLLAVFSFKFNPACVAVEIGLFKSEVLSTLFKPKFVLAPATVFAPVPPLVIATIPVTFSAVLAANANGTAVKG